MTREPYRLEFDITRDYVDRLERMHGLEERTATEPRTADYGDVVIWMVGFLAAGWIIGNL